MENVIIVGTGCAGYTAGIYTARSNLRPLVLAGTQPGGQLSTTTEVENFPGFPEGIQGPELMMKMMSQAQKFGARFNYETLATIAQNADHTFTITTDSASHQAKAVIISTGASPRHLGLPNESQLIGHGLTSCATCDGAFYRDVPVCVIGGGDSACEEATFLTRFASTVYLIHRRDTLRASKIMADRALSHPKIKPIWNSTISEYLTDEKGEMAQARLKNLVTGAEDLLDVKCVFVAIGHVPNTQFLQGFADLDENGYLLQRKGMMTNVEGLFAAGDVSDHVWRQAITAAGQGCAAAIEAERYITERFGL